MESQVSDKDQQLSDYQAKLNSSAPSEQREEELFKQIVDYKDKNNVSEQIEENEKEK